MSHMTSGVQKAIDLFCGCGGIAAGLRMAGMTIVAGADVNPKYVCTFSHNFPEATTIEDDLSKVPATEFAKKIEVEPEELDMIAGGPPCQGFSKNVPRKYRFLEDPNNLLITSFLDYTEFLRPKFVLMENVAEMRNGFNQAYSAEIVSRLEAAGYGVVHMVLNAADYGVPQRRRRAFFLGCRNGSIVASPMPTHTKGSAQNDLLARNGHVTVWEAIGDLPSLHHGDGDGLVGYRCDPFSEYQHAVRGRQMEVANHVARHLRPTQLARLEALAPGQAHKDLPKHLQVRGGYSGVYGRLTKDMIAPTITRWVFHPGSGRWGHPVDTRLITMREAARIQGFPDSFEFVGSYVQQAGQIGNAVPPILVQKVIDAILSQTGNSNLSRKAIA